MARRRARKAEAAVLRDVRQAPGNGETEAGAVTVNTTVEAPKAPAKTQPAKASSKPKAKS